MNSLLKSKSKNSDNYKRKVHLLRYSAHKNLFELSARKCLDFERCTCKLKNRVPLAERYFLCDQRSDRRIMIAELDKAATILNKKRNKQRLERAKQLHHLRLCSETSSNTSKAGMLSEDQSASEMSDSESTEYNVPATQKKRQKRPLPDISVLAEACDCTGVSNRAASFLASSMLHGAGVITENDASLVIDKNKIYRARKKRRMNSVALSKTALHLQSLYYDGRKDQTITQKLINGRMHESNEVEEHIAFIKKPQSEYIGHFATSTGSSQPLFNVFDFVFRFPSFIHTMIFICVSLFNIKRLQCHDLTIQINFSM